MELVNIVCVYYGLKYPIDYVQVLYNMVQRNITVPHRFICFTDHIKPQKLLSNDIEFRKFKHNDYEGWWNKMQLFTEEANLQGPCLYFDLDVVILNNIDDMCTFGNEHTFGVINDFNPNSGLYNSSVMKFNNENAHEIWRQFQIHKTELMQLQGDQNVMSKIVKNWDNKLVMPDDWTYSYKWHDRVNPRFHKSEWKFELRPECKVCVFHGQPNPHNAENEWVSQYWQ